MKKGYILIQGGHYYPDEGFLDYERTFNKIEEAMLAVSPCCEWAKIINLNKYDLVAEFKGQKWKYISEVQIPKYYAEAFLKPTPSHH